jgi:ATP-dependent helicase/nuclease subunit B
VPNTLDITLGPALDGGTAWRHDLASGAARAGWQATGPSGLAHRLAKLVGLPSSASPEPIRAAAWAARIAAHDDGARSYSRARLADAFGVARHLLRMRDELVLAGWDGRPLTGSRRLRDLSELEALASPALPEGAADALRALRGRISALPTLPVPVRVRVAGAATHMDPLVRDVLTALTDRGAEVVAAPPDPVRATPGTDLARLQHAVLGSSEAPSLEGDGTVVSLDAETPWEAAELLAAWMRERPGSRTLVAPAEASVLAAGLTRGGVPALGLASASRWRPALQVLPLRLALAFRPRDPQTAIELLTLPVAPLSRSTRRKLVRALTQMPGLDGPDWREAIEAAAGEAARRAKEELVAEGVSERLADRGADARAGDERQRIASWFGGEAWDPREGIPATEAAAICETVARWAQGRARTTGEPDPLLVHAGVVATALRRMLLTFPPGARVPQVQLEQLHDSAVGSGVEWGAIPGGAGRPALCEDPAAVLPGADEVVWWAFVGECARSAPPPRWTAAERAGAAAAGLALPEPGESRAREAWGWRRPVLAASERLVVLRWRLQGRDITTAHPFEDELRCRVRGWERASRWSPPLVPLTANPPVLPRAIWQLPPEALKPRLPLSATQIDALFGCPLRWALQYVLGLYPADAARVPDHERLVGLLAHRLLQDVLLGWEKVFPGEPLPPEEARRRALAAFDARVEAEAAPLLRPGREVDHDNARRMVGQAAAELARSLAEGGWRVEAAEREVEGAFAGQPFAGSIDLVLRKAETGAAAILDLKLGRGQYRLEELAEGRAVQLALYARGFGGEPLPPTGYFMLKEARLLTASATAFPGATVADGPPAEQTLEQAERRWAQWQSGLERGVLAAPHPQLRGYDVQFKQLTGDWPPPVPKPPCDWCDFATLCTAKIGAP